MKKTMPAELGQGTSCPLTLTDSGRQLSDRQTLGLEHLALQWRRPSPLPDLLPIRTQTWQTHACTHSHTHNGPPGNHFFKERTGKYPRETVKNNRGMLTNVPLGYPDFHCELLTLTMQPECPR